jgi:hypothetical protein
MRLQGNSDRETMKEVESLGKHDLNVQIVIAQSQRSMEDILKERERERE